MGRLRETTHLTSFCIVSLVNPISFRRQIHLVGFVLARIGLRSVVEKLECSPWPCQPIPPVSGGRSLHVEARQSM